MKERTNLITFMGKPLTLVGNEIKVDDKAPGFELLANDLTTVTLDAYRGKTLILSAVPSLDTPVCDAETVRFNNEAKNFGPDTMMVTVSMDLPFAQARWCMEKAAKNMVTLSDHYEGAFGLAYGILIKELRLLARTIFIIDSKGIVQYIQLVKEVSQEPDYEDVLKALEKIT